MCNSCKVPQVKSGPHTPLLLQRPSGGNIDDAASELVERVKNVNLKPLQHKSQCLQGKHLEGFFGSYIKGTHLPSSDLDFAVYKPEGFDENAGKYIKEIFDKYYFGIKSSYGYMFGGEVKGVYVELYFVNPGIKFTPFDIDDLLACELTEEDRKDIIEAKKTASKLGVYGEFGGVPGVAIEYAKLYSRQYNVPFHRVLTWSYIPVKQLAGYITANTVGRTYKINQIVLAEHIYGAIATNDDGIEGYIDAVDKVAGNTNSVFAYIEVKELVPNYLVYVATTRAMRQVLGGKYRVLGRDVVVFGQKDGRYAIGLILPKAWGTKDERFGITPDRLSIPLDPEVCGVTVESGIAFEGGITCRQIPLGHIDVFDLVRNGVYPLYKSAIKEVFERNIVFKLV